MKKHGKGLGINIATDGGHTPDKVSKYLEKSRHAAEGLPRPTWEPAKTKSWPFAPHPRQSDLDAFRAIESRF